MEERVRKDESEGDGGLEAGRKAIEGSRGRKGKRAIIVPLYKAKGRRSECSSYKGISLLSVP